MKIILKKVWDSFLVNPVNVQAPLTKITKKIRNRIINNQLILYLMVLVYKYSYYMRCI